MTARPHPAARAAAPLTVVAVALPAVVVAIVVAAAVVIAWAAVPPAGAAPTQRGDRVEVASQSPFVSSEGEFVASLDWDGPIEDHHLKVRIYQLVGEEDELEERTPSGQLNHLDPIPLADLGRDGEGRLVLRMPVRSRPLPDGDPGRVYLPDPGVYPVELQITGPAGETVASRFTDLIHLPVPGTEREPVPVAVVLPVGRGGLPVADAVPLLERFPRTQITVLVDPAALERADPALVSRLGAALGDRHVVAVPPVPLDVSALAEVDQFDLYEDARRSGAARAAARLGREVDVDVAPLDDRPTQAGADQLAAAKVRALLTPTGTEEGILSTRADDLAVLSPDEDLMEAMGRPGRDAYHVLARLAVRYHQRRIEPVLLTLDPRSGVDAADLEVILTGLDQPGMVEAVPLADVVERAEVELEPRERPRQDLRLTAPLLGGVLSDLAEYAQFHVEGGLTPAALEARLLAALGDDVAPAARLERLAAIEDDVDEAFGTISLPEGRTVNLAATTSPLPLTLTSDATGIRRVRITFSSDKLTFPAEDGGSRVVELAPGITSLDFVVESRSIGVSPLDVVVATPDGTRELARTRITIRSTAVPGLGLLLSGAALAFLVGWWIRHVTRRRRAVPQVVGVEPVA